MSLMIRQARLDDASAIRDIYAYYVEETPISFETEVPSIEIMQERLQTTLNSHAYFVAEDEGEIKAYAYGGFYRSRLAYQNTVETTIYANKDCQGRGIGIQLYNHLLDTLQTQGFHTAVAALTVPNPSSEKLHAKAGFNRIGRLKEVGHKFDQWHDVEWWQLPLISGT